MATNEQIRSFAELGAKIIGLQLTLAEHTPKEALRQIWPYAYCYGAFEALARHYRLEISEAHLLITAGFETLLSDQKGREHLGKAAQVQTHQDFIEGRAHGFDDIRLWVSEKDYRPLMLMNFFAFGKPAPRKP